MLGRKLRLEVADDACEPKQAVPAAISLAQKGAVFVAGHYCSGVAIPASAVYAENNMMLITPAATNPRLTDEAKAKCFALFRCSGEFPDDDEGRSDLDGGVEPESGSSRRS